MKFSKLLLFITLFFSLVLISSCTPYQYPFIEGTYDSYVEINHPSISKAKIVLKSVDQESYYNKNRKNVIEDYYADEQNKYFSLEIYFYLVEKDDYVSISIQNMRYRKETVQVYSGEMLHWEDKHIFPFTLSNAVYIVKGKTVPYITFFFIENGVEYHFYLLLDKLEEDIKK